MARPHDIDPRNLDSSRSSLLLLLVLVQVVLLGELQVPQELGVTTWTRGDVQKHSIGQVRKEGSDLENDR